MTTLISPKRDSTLKETAITVVPYEETLHKDQWDRFVQCSMNGTAFHLQQFLTYHAPERFRFHHLLFFDSRRLVAVLPGGFPNSSEVYESPLGGSYGSFVTGDLNAETALAIVWAFEDYVAAIGIQEVYLTSAPVIYQPILTQNLDFALLYSGYSYQRHYISHAIDLGQKGQPFERFRATARKDIRRMLRVHPELEIEQVANMESGLREFYPILLDNKAKHAAKPTHTLDELLHLHALLPELMQLFLVRVNGEAVAGSLVFVANDRVALIFYHMLLYKFNEYKPIYLLMNRVTAWAKDHGFAFVDIGVSQDTSDENPMTPALSLIKFKEKFDSRGVLRSTLHKSYRA